MLIDSMLSLLLSCLVYQYCGKGYNVIVVESLLTCSSAFLKMPGLALN